MIIGVDLGGTKIEAGLINPCYEVIAQKRCLTKSKEGSDAVIKRLCKLIDEIYWASSVDITGIGVGVAGEVPPSSGMVVGAPNLGWINIPLREILFQRYKIPVVIDNDVNCAVMAEFKFGAGKGKRDIILIAVGTGIGGGIIINGKLLRGKDGCGGEIGHITLEKDGPRCNCGNYGCLEALASGSAIIRQVKDLLKKKKTSIIPHLVKHQRKKMDVNIIAHANELGDEVAIEVLHNAILYLGIGVANLINILNPEIIVLTGGVIQSVPSLIDQIKKVSQLKVMKAARDNVKIVASNLKGQSGLIGAGLMLEQISAC